MTVGSGVWLGALCASVLVPVAIGAQARADSGVRVTGKGATPPPGVKPKLPPTLKVPTTYADLFAERDSRAEAAIGYVGCLQNTVNALRTGALGAVPREWSMACVQQGAEWRGVFGELAADGPGFVVHLQYALRRRAVVTDAVDTVRAGAVARALFRGLSAPLPGAGQYELIPVVLPQPTFVEVWFLPVPSAARAIVGGDSVIQMSRDGTRELGHSKSAAALHPIVVPSTGSTFMVESAEERIPLLSELVIARMALDHLPRVTVRTRQYDAVLTNTATGPAVWKHTRR